MSKKALVVVDYQYDFYDPNGSLYVPEGETIKDYILNKIELYKKNNDLVVASLDWHPQNHDSFKMWPVHSVENTRGSEMPYKEELFDCIIKKGYEKEVDSYSAFLDDNGKSNGLHEFFIKENIKDIEVVGLASDYCVSATISDGIYLGYNVEVDLDGIRGIENKLKLTNNNRQKR